MPVYEYRCEQGHLFDALQRMSDDPLASCTTCEAPVQRVFRPPAIHFKGSGFYTTDYGRAGSSGGSDKGSGESSSSSGSGDGGGESGSTDVKKDSGAKSSDSDGSKASSGSGKSSE